MRHTFAPILSVVDVLDQRMDTATRIFTTPALRSKNLVHSLVQKKLMSWEPYQDIEGHLKKEISHQLIFKEYSKNANFDLLIL